jgi:hypothetical protein
MTESAAHPKIILTGIDSGPADLVAQLPIRAELIRILPGPDRPDYSLAVVSEPITFRTTVATLRERDIHLDAAGTQMTVRQDDTVDVTVFALVLAGRFAGSTIHLSMKDFPVMIAYVIDNTLLEDVAVDFSKCFYAAIGFVSMDDPAATAA